MADTLEDLRRLAYELCEREPASFSVDTLHEAARLAREDPAALTDRHVQHIAVYEPKRILSLLQKRAHAQQQHADQAFAAAQQQVAKAHADYTRGSSRTGEAVALTRAVPPPIDAATLENMSFEELCEKFPDEPVDLGLLGRVHAFIRQMNDNNKLRNARLDALEAANRKLQERILELEATVAAVRT